jgi:hypothetical protein
MALLNGREGQSLNGNAGLDVKRLTGLLQRIKVDCTVVEGDEFADHCLLRLSSLKRPGRVGLVEYVNQGREPRVATIKVEPPDKPKLSNSSQTSQLFWISEEGLNLKGPLKDDPKKIVELVEAIFLEQSA